MSEKSKLPNGSVISSEFNEKAPSADEELNIQVAFEDEVPTKALSQSFADAGADQQSATKKKNAEIENIKRRLEALEQQMLKPGPDRGR